MSFVPSSRIASKVTRSSSRVVRARRPRRRRTAGSARADRAVPDCAAVQRVEVVPVGATSRFGVLGSGTACCVRGRRARRRTRGSRSTTTFTLENGRVVEAERERQRHGRRVVVAQRQPRAAGGRVDPGVRAVDGRSSRLRDAGDRRALREPRRWRRETLTVSAPAASACTSRCRARRRAARADRRAVHGRRHGRAGRIARTSCRSPTAIALADRDVEARPRRVEPDAAERLRALAPRWPRSGARPSS